MRARLAHTERERAARLTELESQLRRIPLQSNGGRTLTVAQQAKRRLIEAAKKQGDRNVLKVLYKEWQIDERISQRRELASPIERSFAEASQEFESNRAESLAAEVINSIIQEHSSEQGGRVSVTFFKKRQSKKPREQGPEETNSRYPFLQDVLNAGKNEQGKLPPDFGGLRITARIARAEAQQQENVALLSPSSSSLIPGLTPSSGT